MKGSLWFRFAEEAYAIAYREKGTKEFNLLAPDFKYWYADPIPFEVDGKHYLAMEVLDKKIGKGFLAISEFCEDGKLSEPCKVIEEPYHLSFPFIYHREGKVYLMPESSANEQIRIYQMGESVYDWKLWTTIDDMKGIVDSVLLDKNDTTYIICTQKKENNYLKSRLKIYKISCWETMEIEDITPSKYEEAYTLDMRNGGSILDENDELIRVRQVSSAEQYGVSLLFSNIKSLTNDSFEEEQVKEMKASELDVKLPSSCRVIGTHTYGCTSKYEVYDLTLAQISFYGIRDKVKRMLHKVQHKNQ